MLVEYSVSLSLQEIQKKAYAALKAKRTAVEFGGFQFDGNIWGSAEKDELRLHSLLKFFERSNTKELSGWKVFEDIYVIITFEIAQRVLEALMRHYAHAYAIEEQKKKEISAQKTVESVEKWISTELHAGW